jgi:hypothetical protein
MQTTVGDAIREALVTENAARVAAVSHYIRHTLGHGWEVEKACVLEATGYAPCAVQIWKHLKMWAIIGNC